uniref:Uncharacterized protein n=1 Tax=Serinus canaria TaxID=9135 RepID=A0A8C9UIV2_SERCA
PLFFYVGSWVVLKCFYSWLQRKIHPGNRKIHPGKRKIHPGRGKIHPGKRKIHLGKGKSILGGGKSFWERENPSGKRENQFWEEENSSWEDKIHFERGEKSIQGGEKISYEEKNLRDILVERGKSIQGEGKSIPGGRKSFLGGGKFSWKRENPCWEAENPSWEKENPWESVPDVPKVGMSQVKGAPRGPRSRHVPSIPSSGIPWGSAQKSRSKTCQGFIHGDVGAEKSWSRNLGILRDSSPCPEPAAPRI